MTAWYLISVRHPVEGQTPRKPWSRTAPVKPKHFVGGYFEMDMFRLYRKRKPWKPWHYRRKNYKLRGYR